MYFFCTYIHSRHQICKCPEAWSDTVEKCALKHAITFGAMFGHIWGLDLMHSAIRQRLYCSLRVDISPQYMHSDREGSRGASC